MIGSYTALPIIRVGSVTNGPRVAAVAILPALALPVAHAAGAGGTVSAGIGYALTVVWARLGAQVTLNH